MCVVCMFISTRTTYNICIFIYKYSELKNKSNLTGVHIILYRILLLIALMFLIMEKIVCALIFLLPDKLTK